MMNRSYSCPFGNDYQQHLAAAKRAVTVARVAAAAASGSAMEAKRAVKLAVKTNAATSIQRALRRQKMHAGETHEDNERPIASIVRVQGLVRKRRAVRKARIR